jgi:hypothetical protein
MHASHKSVHPSLHLSTDLTARCRHMLYIAFDVGRKFHRKRWSCNDFLSRWVSAWQSAICRWMWALVSSTSSLVSKLTWHHLTACWVSSRAGQQVFGSVPRSFSPQARKLHDLHNLCRRARGVQAPASCGLMVPVSALRSPELAPRFSQCRHVVDY